MRGGDAGRLLPLLPQPEQLLPELQLELARLRVMSAWSCSAVAEVTLGNWTKAKLMRKTLGRGRGREMGPRLPGT